MVNFRYPISRIRRDDMKDDVLCLFLIIINSQLPAISAVTFPLKTF